MSMRYFTKDFNQFFKDLSKNNNREWFDQNRSRYKESVKDPFEHFLTDLIGQIQSFDLELNVTPRDCMLRINRDIRFSKDKTPYNTHHTAFVSTAGKKDKSMPGLFLRFGPDMVGIMGGCYMPSKGQLQNIRTSIADDPRQLRSLIEAPGFISKFGKIKGEEHKRIPKEFQASARDEPLIAKKQIYFMSEISNDFVPTEKVLDVVMEYWHTARPVNNYLKKSMNYGI